MCPAHAGHTQWFVEIVAFRLTWKNSGENSINLVLLGVDSPTTSTSHKTLICNWPLIPEVFCAMNPINFSENIVQKREVFSWLKSFD